MNRPTSVRGIFISYRRDDAAGHAGRLFDALKERFGAARVFMDVSDLRPGQDFVAELDRALAASDVVLAVLGPRWLDAADASGTRRIDRPDDFVRREIATALASTATVVPVLVHGARMPAADSLPEPLRPLARRQAVELTDARWPSDVGELVAFLASGDARAPSRTDGRDARDAGSARSLGAGTRFLLVLGVVVALIGAVMLLWPRDDRPAAEAKPAPPRQGTAGDPSVSPATPSGSGAAKTPAGDQSVAAAAAAPAAAVPAELVALPEVRRVKLRTSRATLVIELLAIRFEPGTRTLALLVRALNEGPLDESFGAEALRLEAGDRIVAPEGGSGRLLDAVVARESVFRFVVPAAAAQVALVVRVADNETRIPIALDARRPLPAGPSLDAFGRALPERLVDIVRPLPASFPAGQRVTLATASKVDYTLVSAVIDRETAEKAALTLTVRCAVPREGMGINFWSRSVRLWADGLPGAPLDLVNETVYPGESKEAKFVFELLVMPKTLEVSFEKAGERATVPLDLTALPRGDGAAAGAKR